MHVVAQESVDHQVSLDSLVLKERVEHQDQTASQDVVDPEANQGREENGDRQVSERNCYTLYCMHFRHREACNQRAALLIPKTCPFRTWPISSTPHKEPPTSKKPTINPSNIQGFGSMADKNSNTVATAAEISIAAAMQTAKELRKSIDAKISKRTKISKDNFLMFRIQGNLLKITN